MRIQQYLSDFVNLLFPMSCAGCDTPLVSQERTLCLSCLAQLPVTDFHLDEENESAKQLWGKFDFYKGVSFLRMSKASIVANMVHKLKYGNQPEIGIYIGETYGELLKNAGIFQDLEAIVPIPLHSSKIRKRGYNQAEYFAIGLGNVLCLPVVNNLLVRNSNTASQTTMRRIDRYDNVQSVFTVSKAGVQGFEHLLLVDDVLTTGATLAAAAKALHEVAECKISFATIARAK